MADIGSKYTPKEQLEIQRAGDRGGQRRKMKELDAKRKKELDAKKKKDSSANSRAKDSPKKSSGKSTKRASSAPSTSSRPKARSGKKAERLSAVAATAASKPKPSKAARVSPSSASRRRVSTRPARAPSVDTNTGQQWVSVHSDRRAKKKEGRERADRYKTVSIAGVGRGSKRGKKAYDEGDPRKR